VTADQTRRQRRSDETLLDQARIPSQGRVQLRQTVGRARVPRDARQLVAQRRGADRRVPDDFEGGAFLEVPRDLGANDFRGDGLLEWDGRVQLVSVIDALDRLLGANAILHRQIAGMRVLDEDSGGQEQNG